MEISHTISSHYLEFEKGQQSTPNKCFAISSRPKVVGAVATRRHIGQPEEGAESILLFVSIVQKE
jgi:hypothetical protein